MIQIDKNKIIYPELSYIICGACFKVHNQLGRFRNEKQYCDALANYFINNKIVFKREFPINKSFEGEKDRRNIVDFLIDDKIILEAKTKRIISKDDYYQLKRYLISANKKLGIIVNFRNQYLQPKRILN